MDKVDKTFLVTGAAGFIGASLVNKLLRNKHKVIGIDNLNTYYDQDLKKSRLKEIQKTAENNSSNWSFYEFSIEDNDKLSEIFKKHKPFGVINLAAQAGVRYSIENPSVYVQSNLVGFGNILEQSRIHSIKNLIFASSSSVYGANDKLPFKETDPVNHPVSLYAATKRSNELLAHTYSHLYKIPCTGLRFFTVYGPWGRPDMAPIIFAKAISSGKPIRVFNYGNMTRDYTFIEDITESIYRCCFKPASPLNELKIDSSDPSKSLAPFRLFNIGNSNPIKLLKFIELLEKNLNLKAKKDFQPIQPGDVVDTFADSKELQKWINFTPKTSIENGVELFVDWFKKYY